MNLAKPRTKREVMEFLHGWNWAVETLRENGRHAEMAGIEILCDFVLEQGSRLAKEAQDALPD